MSLKAEEVARHARVTSTENTASGSSGTYRDDAHKKPTPQHPHDRVWGQQGVKEGLVKLE